MNQTTNAKPKLTKVQREALKQYNFALAQEDRYLGSVFVVAGGLRQREEAAKVQKAYQVCINLGMTHEHGL